jgi:hypothetical protein
VLTALPAASDMTNLLQELAQVRELIDQGEVPAAHDLQQSFHLQI